MSILKWLSIVTLTLVSVTLMFLTIASLLPEQSDLDIEPSERAVPDSLSIDSCKSLKFVIEQLDTKYHEFHGCKTNDDCTKTMGISCETAVADSQILAYQELVNAAQAHSISGQPYCALPIARCLRQGQPACIKNLCKIVNNNVIIAGN